MSHFLVRRLAYTYDFVEPEPGAMLVVRTAEGHFPMETTYTWTAVDAHTTRMTLHNCGEPTGFSKRFAPSCRA